MFVLRPLLLIFVCLVLAGCGGDEEPQAAAEPGVPAPQREPGEQVELEVPAIKSDPGTVYRHPIGFSFWHPNSWKVSDQVDYLHLVPPNQGSNPQGPTEAYLITGEDITGELISGPTDPQVVSYLDQHVRQLLPFVNRKGEVRNVNMTSGKGAVIEWEGDNPDKMTVLARCYVGIIGNSAAVLTALGDRKLVEKRDPTVRKMFASFGVGKGEIDPHLVRTWSFLSNTAITNQSPWESDWSRAQLAGETNTTLQLRPDGTWTRHEVSQAIVGAGDVWLDTGKMEEVTEGQWAAGNGTLYLMHKDDSWSVYQYRVEGSRLRLAWDDKGEVWEAR